MAKMDSESKENMEDFGPPVKLSHNMLYFIGGLKSLFPSLIEDATEGTGGLHTVYYTVDELKKLVNSPMDNIILHKVKRYMHLIICNKNLPGEIFRKYPVLTTLATLEFRDFLTNKENNLDSDKEAKYHFECSNFGRVKVNGNILKPIEEKPGWLYIHIDGQKYPVYRIVAETWCPCPSRDSTGWEVHHISNDGYDNTPGNLIWLKSDAHRKIGTPKMQKMNIHFDENENEIKRIIEKLNSQNDVDIITGLQLSEDKAKFEDSTIGKTVLAQSENPPVFSLEWLFGSSKEKPLTPEEEAAINAALKDL